MNKNWNISIRLYKEKAIIYPANLLAFYIFVILQKITNASIAIVKVDNLLWS